ncbi:metallophosphoesterase [Paraprevotella xylaniphila]|uniref:metallophosphoesterase n=1 Tax=Paraprevotella xylaniphila TaxID=454155 RepID=UPI00266CA6A7|nr:metallophosphoesterase [Paraprevotella xylaniphila]
MNHSNTFSLSFPEAKTIIVSGDIHGDFNQLVFKLCIQYQLTDTLLIVAGDCGFGFEKKEYYEQMVRRNVKRMNQANNWIVFVRGNHDNPAYFNGSTFNFKRFIAVPDYTILQACNHTILCVGGAISIDRICRINEWNKRKYRVHSNESQENDISRNLYWQNEAPIYDSDKLNTIHANFLIDTVVTHTAPSYCELFSKSNLNQWAENDPSLIEDIQFERRTMDMLLHHLKTDNHPINHWYYGHFHQSWHSAIDGILYQMLDIMEFCQIF